MHVLCITECIELFQKVVPGFQEKQQKFIEKYSDNMHGTARIYHLSRGKRSRITKIQSKTLLLITKTHYDSSKKGKQI